jgi:hypothetical protein
MCDAIRNQTSHNFFARSLMISRNRAGTRPWFYPAGQPIARAGIIFDILTLQRRIPITYHEKDFGGESHERSESGVSDD